MVQRSGEEGRHKEQVGEYAQVLLSADPLHPGEDQVELKVLVMFVRVLLLLKTVQIEAEQPGVQPNVGNVKQKLSVCVLLEEIVLQVGKIGQGDREEREEQKQISEQFLQSEMDHQNDDDVEEKKKVGCEREYADDEDTAVDDDEVNEVLVRKMNSGQLGLSM